MNDVTTPLPPAPPAPPAPMPAPPMPTPSELLTDEKTRKQLQTIVKLLNASPETANPSFAADLIKAAIFQAQVDKGQIVLPPPEADPEQDAIRQARHYLDDYGEYVHGYTPTAFHLAWQRALLDPHITQLVINVPPDHAKTQVVSIQFPAFMIGRNPNMHIGLISNTATQAERKSVAVRDTIALNPRYRAVFPNVLPDNHKGWSEAEWYVKRSDPGDKDSTFKATGFRGPITGDRYDLIIIDDLADQENTQTSYQRAKVAEWVRDTVLPRLAPGGKVVVIGTRWHHDDLYAYLRGRAFTSIHMPALVMDPVTQQEHALWEARHPLAELQQLRTLEPLMFERVYQGNPTPSEGALIKEHWWHYYQHEDLERLLSEADRIVQVLDTASKDKTINDFSVVMTLAFVAHNAYLINVVREKVQYPQLKRLAISEFTIYHPDAVVIESASSGIALFQDLQQTTAMPVRDLIVDKNKTARLSGVLDYVASGRVYLPDKAVWLTSFLRECAEFPLGDHDDQVDTLSMGLTEIFQPRGQQWASPTFLSLGQDVNEVRTRIEANAARQRPTLTDMIAP